MWIKSYQHGESPQETCAQKWFFVRTLQYPTAAEGILSHLPRLSVCASSTLRIWEAAASKTLSAIFGRQVPVHNHPARIPQTGFLSFADIAATTQRINRTLLEQQMARWPRHAGIVRLCCIEEAGAISGDWLRILH